MNGLCSSCFIRSQVFGSTQAIRYKSTSSSIYRGLDATNRYTRDTRPRSSYRHGDGDLNKNSPTFRINREPKFDQRRQHANESEPWQNRNHSSEDPSQARNDRRTYQQDSHIPLSIPRTTAASQFLYGANVVLAALKARRRKLYRLHILSRGEISSNSYSKPGQRPSERSGPDFQLIARNANLPFTHERNLKLFDKMSAGRPHNGIILEASTPPAPPVTSLSRVSPEDSSIPITLDWQSPEDSAVNGTPSSIPRSTETWRYPLIVMLDGITDPENIGSILRSSHFYGVEAVAVATNTCATLASPVLAKASSGACEAVQLLSLSRPSDFVYKCAQAGWEVYAAVAPSPAPKKSSSSAAAAGLARPRTTAEIAAENPLARKPCILMLGSEGAGLRDNLRRRANRFVTIESRGGPAGVPDVGVDSMNVGVAAGVLLEAFLRKPVRSKSEGTGESGNDLGW